MNSLPNKKQMPSSICLEAPQPGLASLASTPELEKITEVVLKQWAKRDRIDRLAHFGIYPIRKLLFYGPPGNGKTATCQWMGQKLGMPLYRIRCDQLIASHLGESARNLVVALDWLKEAGSAIVLFDEVDTIFTSRDAKTNSDTILRELTATLAALWQALDRWATPQLFVFATNRIEAIDPALLSRFEIKVEFRSPTAEQVVKVVDYWAEVLHEFQSDRWAPALREKRFDSFRQLWITISDSVREIAIGGDS